MEIEIKAKVNNFTGIKNNLKKIKAKYEGKKSQVDYYYSLYKRPIGKPKGDVFRLRYDRIKKEARIEFHKPKNAYAAEEIELPVGDFNTAKKLLKAMKARQEFKVDKERLIYKKGRVNILLDKVKYLGKFIEVEIEGKYSKKNIKIVYDLLDTLGVDRKDIILHDHYHGMILKKKGKKHAYF